MILELQTNTVKQATRVKIQQYKDEYIVTLFMDNDRVKQIMSFDHADEAFDWIRLNT